MNPVKLTAKHSSFEIASFNQHNPLVKTVCCSSNLINNGEMAIRAAVIQKRPVASWGYNQQVTRCFPVDTHALRVATIQNNYVPSGVHPQQIIGYYPAGSATHTLRAATIQNNDVLSWIHHQQIIRYYPAGSATHILRVATIQNNDVPSWIHHQPIIGYYPAGSTTHILRVATIQSNYVPSWVHHQPIIGCYPVGSATQTLSGATIQNNDVSSWAHHQQIIKYYPAGSATQTLSGATIQNNDVSSWAHHQQIIKYYPAGSATQTLSGATIQENYGVPRRHEQTVASGPGAPEDHAINAWKPRKLALTTLQTTSERSQKQLPLKSCFATRQRWATNVNQFGLELSNLNNANLRRANPLKKKKTVSWSDMKTSINDKIPFKPSVIAAEATATDVQAVNWRHTQRAAVTAAQQTLNSAANYLIDVIALSNRLAQCVMGGNNLSAVAPTGREKPLAEWPLTLPGTTSTSPPLQ